MALELVMNVVGFLAATVSPLCFPQVLRPYMHWSASTTVTPVSDIIVLISGSIHDLA